MWISTQDDDDSSPIEVQSVLVKPISQVGDLLDRRLNQLRWRTSINDQAIKDIIDSTSNPLLKKARVSNLLWQVYGGGVDNFHTQEERAELTNQLINQVQSGDKPGIDLPEPGAKRLPDAYMEAEVLLLGLRPGQLTHAALPLHVFAGRDPQKNELVRAYGTPQVSLLKEENGKWIVEAKFLAPQRKASEEIFDVTSMFSEHGAGLLGLIPLIEPKFRKEVLEWNDPFKTELELNDRLSTLAFDRGVKKIPIQVDQYATTDSVSTFKGAIKECIEINKYKDDRDGGPILIGTVHTHIEEGYLPAEIRLFETLRKISGIQRDPRKLLNPDDFISFFDTYDEKIKSYSLEGDPKVGIVAAGIAFAEGGKTQEPLMFRGDALDDREERLDVAYMAREDVGKALEREGDISGLKHLPKHFELTDARTYPMSRFPNIDMKS